jgi:hypothetical protein
VRAGGRKSDIHTHPRKWRFRFLVGCGFVETTSHEKGSALNEFISRYREHLSGTLSGFDRLVFPGNLSRIHEAGMKGYLWASQVAWKDYATPVAEVSKRVKEAGRVRSEAAGVRSII